MSEEIQRTKLEQLADASGLTPEHLNMTAIPIYRDTVPFQPCAELRWDGKQWNEFQICDAYSSYRAAKIASMCVNLGTEK